MKKRLLLAVAIASVLMIVLAIGISANGIVANTITSETFGTVYQLTQDPGLDGAEAYVSVLNTIDDQGKDTESLSIMFDGTYYYVFPTSYLVDEYSNGKLSFTLKMGAGNNFSSKQKGINDIFSEWNEAENVGLPAFETANAWGNTRINGLVRIEISTDVGFIDRNHCLIRGDELVEVRFTKSIGINIAGGLFANNPKLTTVIGLDMCTGTNFPSSMFSGCSSLVSVKLPSDMTSIPKESFYNCTSFKGIENWDEIKNNVKSVGDYAFSKCNSLVSIDLPSLTSIGNQAFSYCATLETVDLTGSSFVKLNAAFRNCPMLDGIVLPETVDGISQDGFHGCSSLTYFKVPRDATYIGNYAFNGCSKLETFDMSGAVNLKSTGSNTFNSSAITELVFPEGFESFGGFGSASKLTYVYFPNSTTSIGGIQFAKIPSYTIPLGVTVLKSKTLDYCGTSTVTIHKGVTEVSSQAFYGMSVTTIIYTGSENDAVVEQIKVAAPKANIIYADQCETYFGTHAWSGNATMQEVDYFKGVFFADTCTRNGCGVNAIDDSKTIGAMFVDYGYSATENAINGAYSVSQFYGINRVAIEQYRAYRPDFEFGIVVAVYADPFGTIASDPTLSDKVYVAGEKFLNFDYVSVRIGGISDANMDKALTFCIYVNDNNDVSYLDGGETVDSVTMKSHRDIVAITNSDKTVE